MYTHAGACDHAAEVEHSSLQHFQLASLGTGFGTCAMLPLQLLIRRPHAGLLQEVVELIIAFACIEPEVWQCPIVASLVTCF